MIMRRLLWGFWLVLLAGASPAWAQTAFSQALQDTLAAESQPSTFDRIWTFAEWYENESNPAVQRVLFSGRFQVDYASLDADQGRHSEWNIRRFRFGVKAEMFRNVTLHSEVEFNPQEADPVYERLTDTYVEWSRDGSLAVTLGKHSAPFTADGSTSSKELIAIDRSNLTNNFWFTQEYFPGVSVSGERSAWVYQAGLYSAGARNREFGDFSGSVFFLGVAGYDFADRWDVGRALLSANYVYQNPDPDNTFTRNHEQVLSINFKLDADAWGAHADYSTSAGYEGEQSDLWGVMVMPFYNVTDTVQLVARYTYLSSDEVNGVLLNRYENQFVSGRGDEYNEGYFGFNYYVYGHKLKFQTGVQFADMQDRADDGGAYNGVAWTSGLRVSW